MQAKKISLLLAILFTTITAFAQQASLPHNKNAALRYWMAFAELQDRPLDQGTAKLMEDVLSGAAPWDEQRLGPIIDANVPAIRAMQRGTALPECNWGLDYDRGSAMSLGHLPKARVLARLNALYGARQNALGDTDGAVNTWLAGLRFAQDISRDVGLIAPLSAKASLLANLHFLTTAVESGHLSREALKKIRLQTASLPEEGVDWTVAIKFEAWANEESLKDLAQSKNFQETYKTFFSQPPPPATAPPKPADIAEHRALMDEVQTAFQLPYEQTKVRLSTIEVKTKALHPAAQAVTPNYSRMNEARHQIDLQEQSLARALATSGD